MNEFKLSIIIPAYNEEKRIGQTLDFICNYLQRQSYRGEILVVDDGSSDRTQEVVQKKMATCRELRLLSYGRNRGKGYAIRYGVRKAKGEYILFADADNATPFEEIEKLLPYKDKYDIVMGSRYITQPKPGELSYLKSLWHSIIELLSFVFLGGVPETTIKKKQSWFRQLMSRGGNLIFVLFLGLGYEDTRCGFKLYRKDVAKRLFSLSRLDRWGFDTEILVIAKKYKYKVIEVPVVWYDVAGGAISKNPFKEAISSFKEIFQILWYKWRGKYNQ